MAGDVHLVHGNIPMSLILFFQLYVNTLELEYVRIILLAGSKNYVHIKSSELQNLIRTDNLNHVSYIVKFQELVSLKPINLITPMLV